MKTHLTFHDFWFGLKVADRATYAQQVKTSPGYLEKLAGGFSTPSLRMAARMVRADSRVSYDAIVRTSESKAANCAAAL